MFLILWFTMCYLSFKLTILTFDVDITDEE